MESQEKGMPSVEGEENCLRSAAMRIDQREPREVAKNQMLDNNTSFAIRKIRSGKMILFERFGPIFEKNLP